LNIDFSPQNITIREIFNDLYIMTSDHKLVIKDAAWQLFGRIISALFGFVITKIISSYLWPLRYGDYGTIFRYFAWWTALVDFGIYVIAVKRLGALKEEQGDDSPELKENYHKFLGTRVFMIIVIYTLAIVVAYLIPAYTSNEFIIRGLPLAMLYSASNMFVGIQQLPLQLFWKMNRLSWSLIVARLSQLVILIPTVFFFFKDLNFEGTVTTKTMVLGFCLVVFSVVASAIGQNIDVHLRSKELLPFKIRIDKQFIKNIFTSNRKYGFAYFFSSFHTLIVLMFMGRFFPTSEGFKYSGFWALSLSLIEILLIIPSSLGNSLLHKIPNYEEKEKKKSLGNLLNLVVRIGGIIAINFWIFSKEIITIVSKEDYLGTWESRWSDQILPFLGIVLVLSFIKQIFNYLFVAVDKQNVLFKNNLIGVTIWVLVGIFVIPEWNLMGGVITQILIESFFTWGAIWIAKREKSLPILQKKNSLIIGGILGWMALLGRWIRFFFPEQFSLGMFFVVAGVLNLFILGISFPVIKKVAKGLTKEEK